MGMLRLYAIASKEFKHLFRDIRMLMILLLFPAFLLVVFGYAVNFDVTDINIAVYDNDHSDLSRDLIRAVTSNQYFRLTGVVSGDKAITTTLDEAKAQCVMVIPKDFSRGYYSNSSVKVQFLVEGINSNTASIIQSYVQAAIGDFNRKLAAAAIAKRGIKNYQPLDIRPVFRYNPDLKTTMYLLPGLIGMILIITSVVSVSLSLVREKERSTIEQINVSPIRIPELLIGKAIPYFLLALVNAGLVLLTGYIFFGITVQGSILLLALCTMLFLFAAICMGIFISVVSETQQIAFMIATFATLLPSVILSGFIFPIESMPLPIQVLTNITPVKFYNIILRAIVLRGAGVETFLPQLGYLALFAAFFLMLAALVYRKQQRSA